MWDYGITFFSEVRASKFADQLKRNCAKDVTILHNKDGFSQNIYKVVWNK